MFINLMTSTVINNNTSMINHYASSYRNTDNNRQTNTIENKKPKEAPSNPDLYKSMYGVKEESATEETQKEQTEDKE
ncbi:hypothetical protein IJG14_07560 [bacterium]|nr:hypothetical protein [bacterium]